MEIIIKKFNELSLEELYEIVKARVEVFVCEQEITCENEFDDRDRKAIHIFSMNNGVVAGYIRILPKGIGYKEAVSIGRVLVRNEYRRSGVAQKLIKEGVRYAKENYEGENIVLSSQLYVKKLYETIGFKTISDVYDEANIPHIKMEYREI